MFVVKKMSFLKISDPVKRDLIVKEYLKIKKNIRDNLLVFLIPLKISGVRRVASSVIPESVQRRVIDFGNWLIGRVGPEQTP